MNRHPGPMQQKLAVISFVHQLVQRVPKTEIISGHHGIDAGLHLAHNTVLYPGINANWHRCNDITTFLQGCWRSASL